MDPPLAIIRGGNALEVRKQVEDLAGASQDEGWDMIHNRNQKRKEKRKIRAQETEGRTLSKQRATFQPTPAVQPRGTRAAIRGNPPRRRLPKTAAVSLTLKGDENKENRKESYKAILLKARQAISLTALDIEKSQVRQAANGGILIEIQGSDGAVKADTLASKLTEAVGDQVVVARPVTRAELRFIGLDDSVTPEEIQDLVAEAGDCSPQDVKVGQMREMPNGLNTAWVLCPLAAALKVAKKEKVRIGWTTARVVLLRKRPTQCFKCWRFGHVRFACSYPEDRSAACFNCGRTGHSSRTCGLPPHCVLCHEAGRDSGHRLGSTQCGEDRNPKRISARPNNSRAQVAPMEVEPVRRTEPSNSDYEL